jgi:hypothetical protein
MKKPTCDCMKKAMNQFCCVDEITSLATVFYVTPENSKGYEERECHIKSLYCPQCGEKYEEVI